MSYRDALTVAALLTVALVLTACADKGASRAPVDWPALAAGAAPEYRVGECGPEVFWKKTVAAYDTVEIEGTLTIRRKCDEVPPIDDTPDDAAPDLAAPRKD